MVFFLQHDSGQLETLNYETPDEYHPEFVVDQRTLLLPQDSGGREQGDLFQAPANDGDWDERLVQSRKFSSPTSRNPYPPDYRDGFMSTINRVDARLPPEPPKMYLVAARAPQGRMYNPWNFATLYRQYPHEQ